MNEPNLLPRSLLVRRSRRRRTRQWQAVLVLESALAVAAGLLLNVQTSDPDAMTKAAIQATVAQIDVVTGAANETRSQLQDVQQQLAVATAVARRPDWSILLATISWSGQGRVVLDSIQLSPGASGPAAASGYRLAITGVCPQQSDLTHFVETLESTGLFLKVKATQTQSLPNPAEPKRTRLGFTIEAEITERGA